MKEVKCPVEVSARHIHLSKKDYEFLFGADTPYKITKKLSQIGEFATDKKVTIIGPDGELSARFLGPFRQRTQVELSLTDCYVIGVAAPYSVEVEDSAANVKIKGEFGEIVREALIVPKRHLHLNPKQAARHGISPQTELEVLIDSDRGKIVFSDLAIKIANNYRLSVHLDTDEGNAAGIKGEFKGILRY